MHVPDLEMNFAIYSESLYRRMCELFSKDPYGEITHPNMGGLHRLKGASSVIDMEAKPVGLEFRDILMRNLKVCIRYYRLRQ